MTDKPGLHAAQGAGEPRRMIGDPFPGYRRDSIGSDWLTKWTPPKCGGNIPERTLENIAACSALGLSYWCETTGGSMIIGVDADQHSHQVRVDRKSLKAEHYCSQTWRYDPKTQGPRHATRVVCAKEGQRDVSWAIPKTMSALMLVMDHDNRTDVSAQRGRTGWCGSDQHHRCEYRPGGKCEGGITTSLNEFYDCPCECHTTEETEMPVRTPASDKTAKSRAAARRAEVERREKAAKTTQAVQKLTPPRPSVYDANREPAMSREQAKALLAHDPDYLGDITNAALVDLLDDESLKKYHPRIRRELKSNRGLTQRAS